MKSIVLLLAGSTFLGSCLASESEDLAEASAGVISEQSDDHAPVNPDEPISSMDLSDRSAEELLALFDFTLSRLSSRSPGLNYQALNMLKEIMMQLMYKAQLKEAGVSVFAIEQRSASFDTFAYEKRQLHKMTGENELSKKDIFELGEVYYWICSAAVVANQISQEMTWSGLKQMCLNTAAYSLEINSGWGAQTFWKQYLWLRVLAWWRLRLPEEAEKLFS